MVHLDLEEKEIIFFSEEQKKKEQIKPFNRLILSSSSSVVNVSTNIRHFYDIFVNVFLNQTWSE